MIGLIVVQNSICEDKTKSEEFNLQVSNYVSSTDKVKLQWPTHIAFGPNNQEIICDLKSHRFLYRNGPNSPLLASPINFKKPHSLVYNPVDKLYYINDTDHHSIIAVRNLAENKIAAETKKIAGITLQRPHDVVLDPKTGWLYAINPNSGHVFRFTAIGKNESAIKVPVQGYARSLTFVNGKLFVIGSAKGRVVEIVDWDKKAFKIYDSFDPTKRNGPAGSWDRTGLVLNDVDFYEGHWYATSYFTKSYAKNTDYDKNKFIRFKNFEDFVAGKWTDLSELLPTGMTPYYLTVNKGKLYLAIFNHESAGRGDGILQFTTVSP